MFFPGFKTVICILKGFLGFSCSLFFPYLWKYRLLVDSVTSAISTHTARSRFQERENLKPVWESLFLKENCTLGHLLFTLYTRHLPALLTIQCVMFADDILLFFSSPSQQNCARVLSSALSDLNVLVDDLGLQINVKKKTQAMFVLPRAISRTDDVLVYCHGRALETVASYK